MALMTEQDLIDGKRVADEFIARLENMRPPAAVAALAIALAAVTHLAKCGPDASIKLFESYYRKLGEVDRRR